jgi:hypothetical protein
MGQKILEELKKEKREKTMKRNVKKLSKVVLFPDLVFPLSIRAVSPQQYLPLSNREHSSAV